MITRQSVVGKTAGRSNGVIFMGKTDLNKISLIIRSSFLEQILHTLSSTALIL